MVQDYELPDLSKSCVYLSITSWDGILSYARHYFGTLRFANPDSKDWRDRTIEREVTRLLTAAEAARLNKNESDYQYHEGDICGRFFSEEEVIAAAELSWKKEFPLAKYLIIGSSCSADPVPIVGWRRKAKWIEQANAICKEFDDKEGWEYGDDAVIEEISARWNKLVVRSLSK